MTATPRRRRLHDLTWPDVPHDGLVVVPVGSTEQHGPHLPLDTDTVIATAVGSRVATLLGGTMTPPITFGASGEHQSFAGTASIGTNVLTDTLIELARSVTEWARRVVFVNGHGGNVGSLRVAVQVLVDEGRDVMWVPCTVEDADAHAGRTETSLMLHLDPDRVLLDRAIPGNPNPIAGLMPDLIRGGVCSVSSNGVLGDPTGASAHDGQVMLREMVAAATNRVGQWQC